jgi:hypothetical protein
LIHFEKFDYLCLFFLSPLQTVIVVLLYFFFFFPRAVTDMEGFNSHLNMEQMNKALISLNEMYNKAAAEGRPSPNGKNDVE